MGSWSLLVAREGAVTAWPWHLHPGAEQKLGCPTKGIKLRVMRCATFVLMSSTATFTIFNPLSSQQPSATRSSLFLSPGRLAETRGSVGASGPSTTWNYIMAWESMPSHQPWRTPGSVQWPERSSLDFKSLCLSFAILRMELTLQTGIWGLMGSELSFWVKEGTRRQPLFCQRCLWPRVGTKFRLLTACSEKVAGGARSLLKSEAKYDLWDTSLSWSLSHTKTICSTAGAHLPGQGRRESTDKRSELHRCLLAQCSIVQDFPLNTNPQFTALPQVMPSVPHTAMLCLTRQTTTNSGVKWIRWLELPKPRWQRRSNTEHAADQAPTCK